MPGTERTAATERFGAFVDVLTERDGLAEDHKAKLLELKERLSGKRTAIVYASMEVYDREENDLKGGGGLGVLAGDTRRVYEELGIPEVVLTPFYTEESHQTLEDFWQVERLDSTDPNRLYQNLGNVAVATGSDSRVHLDVFGRELGSTKILTVTEPNFGELYPGGNSGNHRLYQEIALGFGGYKVLKREDIEPVFTQLNEAPTVFLSIAHIDDLVTQGASLAEALETVQAQTLFTNHTLVPAVEGEFGWAQFEHFVMPNIESQEVKDWIATLFDEQNRLRLSLLAAEVSGVQSGVSKLHAEVADYYHADGRKVEFKAVTNGISQKWIHPGIYEAFRDRGVLDEFGLPTPEHAAAIDTFNIATIRELKQAAKDEMNRILAGREDQYGQPIHIPDGAITFDFKRRFASYKRPDMPFSQPDILARILAEHDGHFLLTGKPHPNDDGMKDELHRILQLVDSHPVLRDRVHYVVDYDEEVGRALALGADAALNLPVVGEEACGTSWMKDIANFKILISTPDGGVADVQPIACLEVNGDEHASLYEQMNNAATIIRDDVKYEAEVKRELSAYIETISGARMAADYLDLLALASLANR